MEFLKGESGINQLQWLVWLSVLIIILFSFLQEYTFIQSALEATCYTVSFAIIVYGNIYFLYPRFFIPGKIVYYIFGILALLLISGFSRAFVYYHYLSAKPDSFTWHQLIPTFLGSILILILSYIIRVALAYISLKKHNDQMLFEKSQAELRLLKAQVQPHFLFNTLNNIYYEAFNEAPRTAALIERLADMMRYFVDETQKDQILIATELKFLEDYLELEQIRVRHKTSVEFIKKYRPMDVIPPMLLMPFIENIFKHGIDRSKVNTIMISLTYSGDDYLFETRNKVVPTTTQRGIGGFGLINLHQRLTLLYGNNFSLNTKVLNEFFIASVKIPIR